MATQSPPTSRGRHAAWPGPSGPTRATAKRGRRRGPLAWLPWLLLAVLALLLLGIGLIVRAAGHTDHDAPKTAAIPAPSPAVGPQPSSSSAVLVDGQPLLPISTNQPTPVAANRPIQGHAANVQQVVSPKAFWVGDSPQNRVLVELLGPSPIPLAVGEKVSFTGKTDPNHPTTPTELGITDQTGIQQMAQQGVHIDIDPSQLRQG